MHIPTCMAESKQPPSTCTAVAPWVEVYQTSTGLDSGAYKPGRNRIRHKYNIIYYNIKTIKYRK